MMAIVSKMWLEEIHKVCVEQKDGVEEADLNVQKDVLKNLRDWKPDDCMIDGYEYDSFIRYETLIPSIREYVQSNTAQCQECTHAYKKTEMVNDHTCEDCAKEVATAK